MDQINDSDVWHRLPTEYLWIYDKLIVARKQGIIAGPAGILPPKPDFYIVRPITNIRMMGRGAKKVFLENDRDIPDGYFWSEVLEGRHISVDYNYGVQKLTVEGFRDSDRLDRFSLWKKVDGVFPFPSMLKGLESMEWVNVEYIGEKAIEVHLRYNDDFANHNSDVVIPLWKEENPLSHDSPKREYHLSDQYEWYESSCEDRLGFYVKKDI